jgi:hypothetical protein
MEWLSGLGHEHQLWIQRDTFAPATTDATLNLIATFRRHEVSYISYYDAGRDGMITFRIQAKACIKKGKTCTYRAGSMVYHMWKQMVSIIQNQAVRWKPSMKSDWMASATQMLVLLCQTSDRSKTGSAQYPGLFEWIQDPDKKWHQLYFMRKDPLRFLDKSERSFFANYAQEIAYVKWLLGEPNDRFGRNRNWMFTFGPIQVLFDKSCLWRPQKNLRTFLHQHVLLTQASRLLQHLFTTDRTPKKHTV